MILPAEPLSDKDDPLYWQMRRDLYAFLTHQHWWWFHFTNGSLHSLKKRAAAILARWAEERAAEWIRAMGYKVWLTTPNCPFDLWVSNDQGNSVRVEVKVSLYYDSPKGGRYQANVRHHDQADPLIFIARQGRECWPFIIPMSHIGPRRNVAIWSNHPLFYAGRWVPYLGAWQYLHETAAQVQPVYLQLPLASSVNVT